MIGEGYGGGSRSRPVATRPPSKKQLASPESKAKSRARVRPKKRILAILESRRHVVCVQATGALAWPGSRLVLAVAVAAAVLAAHVLHVVHAASTSSSATSTSQDSKDFVLYNTLEDGEVETRIRYKGLLAKQVTVGRGLGIKFRQLTDGKHFIQLIYDEDDTISDCEYLHQKQSVLSFVDTFKRDVHLLTTVYNATLVELENGKLPGHMKKWMNYKKLRDQCKEKHQELRKLLKSKGRSAPEEISAANRSREGQRQRQRRRRHPRDLNKMSNYLLFPGTIWCGHSDAASKYTDLGPMSGADRCCRRHDHCHVIIPGFSRRFGYFNDSPFTVSDCRCDKSGPGRGTDRGAGGRRRRELGDLGEYLRVPGTKWCGKGRSASKYTDVGMFSTTDKCCRRHDSACPFWIAGFDTKYGLFNWRVNTIMHCACDERFRTCLKRVGTSDANLVGKLFFNVVQTKCFVFKPKKTCVERSWWGKCQKKKIKKQAVLRDNMPY